MHRVHFCGHHIYVITYSKEIVHFSHTAITRIVSVITHKVCFAAVYLIKHCFKVFHWPHVYNPFRVGTNIYVGEPPIMSVHSTKVEYRFLLTVAQIDLTSDFHLLEIKHFLISSVTQIIHLLNTDHFDNFYVSFYHFLQRLFLRQYRCYTIRSAEIVFFYV